MASITVLRPDIPFADTSWVLDNAFSVEVGAEAWKEQVRDLSSNVGLRRFVASLFKVISEEAYWAERWARKTTVEDGEWLAKALGVIRANPLHPLWPPLSFLFLAYVGKSKFYPVIPDVAGRLDDAVRSKSQVILSDVLSSISDENLSILSNLARQFLPWIVAIASRQTNALDSRPGKAEAPGVIECSPWQSPTAFQLTSIFSEEWSSLSSGDITTFTPVEEEDVPDLVHFRIASSFRDDDVSKLIALANASDEDADRLFEHLRHFRSVATPYHRADILLVGLDKGPDSQPLPIGICLVTRTATLSDRFSHHVDLVYAYLLPEVRGRYFGLAIRAALRHQFQEDLEAQYNKMIPPGARMVLAISPDIGETSAEWFVGALGDEMRAVHDFDEDLDLSTFGYELDYKRGTPDSTPVDLPQPLALELDQDDVGTFVEIERAIRNLCGFTFLGPLTLRVNGSKIRLGVGFDEVPYPHQRTSKDTPEFIGEALRTLRSRKSVDLLKKLSRATVEPSVFVFWAYGPHALMEDWAWEAPEDMDEHELPVWLISGGQTTSADAYSFWKHFPDVLTAIMQERSL